MIARAIALIAVTALAAAGQPLDLLQRIRERMARNLAKVPNYTCLQSVDRSERESRRDNFTPRDKVRLEVALVEGKELFSWPGAGRFEERHLSAFVSGGVAATGDYALHAHAVFVSSSPRFEFGGESDLDGRRAWRFNYKVAPEKSGYGIRAGNDELIAGYHGSFWADVDSLDILRLDVIVDALPKDFGVSRAETQIQYARSRVGESDFLLPRRVDMVTRASNGIERRNQTEFARCHQYVGETTISFEEPASGSEAPAAPTVSAIELPAGLSLAARLDQPIVFANVALGDTVTATVVSAVRKSGKIVVPKGAVLEGRVREFTRVDKGFVAIGIEMTDIRFEGAAGPLAAELSRLATGTRSREMAVIPPQEGKFGAAIFVRTSQLSRLPAGLAMQWVTLPPRR